MRAIDADFVYELHGNYPAFARSFADLTDLRDILDEAPTLTLDDLRPHGLWGDYEPYPDGYRCSHCKLMHRSCTAYCPNCGADMRGGGEDG